MAVEVLGYQRPSDIPPSSPFPPNSPEMRRKIEPMDQALPLMRFLQNGLWLIGDFRRNSNGNRFTGDLNTTFELNGAKIGASYKKGKAGKELRIITIHDLSDSKKLLKEEIFISTGAKPSVRYDVGRYDTNLGVVEDLGVESIKETDMAFAVLMIRQSSFVHLLGTYLRKQKT